MSSVYAFLALLTVVGLYLWFRVGDNSNRLQALKRLAVGVPFLLLLFVLGWLFAAYIIGVFILDVLWQLTTGREGFSSGGNAERLQEWRDQNTRYIIHGDASPKLIP